MSVCMRCGEDFLAKEDGGIRSKALCFKCIEFMELRGIFFCKGCNEEFYEDELTNGFCSLCESVNDMDEDAPLFEPYEEDLDDDDKNLED